MTEGLTSKYALLAELDPVCARRFLFPDPAESAENGASARPESDPVEDEAEEHGG